jgi:hypothetical protein
MTEAAKLKIICKVKDASKRIKRQVTEWRKIFVKGIPDKGLFIPCS